MGWSGMVEVLRKGKKPEDRQYEVTCRHCRAQLRFKRSEARYSSDQRDGNALTVACPECKHDVWVEESQYLRPDDGTWPV